MQSDTVSFAADHANITLTTPKLLTTHSCLLSSAGFMPTCLRSPNAQTGGLSSGWMRGAWQGARLQAELVEGAALQLGRLELGEALAARAAVQVVAHALHACARMHPLLGSTIQRQAGALRPEPSAHILQHMEATWPEQHTSIRSDA
jgi:hypothetical protein